MKTRLLPKLLLICLTLALLVSFACQAYAYTVKRSTQKLKVDGKPVVCERYSIDGGSYFKLRDLAYLLNGTDSQFSTEYDAVNGYVILTRGMPYEPIGSELTVGADLSASAVPTMQTILIDSTAYSDLSIFNIGGSNYFKVSEIAEAIGFNVTYDAATDTEFIMSRETVHTVERSPQKLMVNGKLVECDKYNVDGSNYYYLRDLAYLLNGTSSQFSIEYDAANDNLILTMGAPYVPVGSELTVGSDFSATAVKVSQTLVVDGVSHDLTAFNIGGTNAFRLRDIAEAVGLVVEYDSATDTAIVWSNEPAYKDKNTEITDIGIADTDKGLACVACIGCASNQSVIAYGARYDAYGRFLGVEVIHLHPGRLNPFNLLYDGADTIRVFVVDTESSSPICAAKDAPASAE